MSYQYTTLLKSFKEFAETALKNQVSYKTVRDFSMEMSKKATQIINLALIGRNTNIIQLKKELYEIEKSYISRYASLKKNDY